MTHSITITKQDFFENSYYDNDKCPLAVALTKHFGPCKVHVTAFEFEITLDKKGYINRSFSKCTLISKHSLFEYRDSSDLSDIILEYAQEENFDLIQDVTFTFETI